MRLQRKTVDVLVIYHLPQAAEIVQLILDNGKLRPPEVISRLSIYDPVKGTTAIYP